MQNEGTLYIVATPIGNLDDITLRAITVLKQVDLIAAEDTRHSRKLLQHYGITAPLYSLHAHNEKTHYSKILETLRSGRCVAYITDAGTPLISDPGAYLVQVVRHEGIKIVPIPGACAAITALSVSGFTEPHFYFEGFLPHKSSARRKRLEELKSLRTTLIFYESPHRVQETLADLVAILGNRFAVIARELTKKYETILSDTLVALVDKLLQSPEQRLGEFVLLVAGSKEPAEVDSHKVETLLRVLLAEVPLKKAVQIASNFIEMNKNDLYALALTLKDENKKSS